jgi:uncharacterized protein (TIGR02453 family)
MKRPYFTPDLFSFLSELRQHNERGWFEHHKARYETVAREPALRFIADIASYLAKISPYFVADPRPVGGSMMRIYRDVRFSKDKSPYKTSVGIHFWHQARKDDIAPAFYLHLEPGACVAGGGVWRPDGVALKAIRDSIGLHGNAWRRAIASRRFESDVSLVGESLKQAPKGYDPDHPFIVDIKRRDFAASIPLTDDQVTGTDFMSTLLDTYHTISPFIRFLSEALKLSF